MLEFISYLRKVAVKRHKAFHYCCHWTRDDSGKF